MCFHILLHMTTDKSTFKGTFLINQSEQVEFKTLRIWFSSIKCTNQQFVLDMNNSVTRSKENIDDPRHSSVFDQRLLSVGIRPEIIEGGRLKFLNL